MSIFESIPDKLGGGKPRITKEQLEKFLLKSKDITDQQLADKLNKKFTTMRGKEFNADNIFPIRRDLGIETTVYKMSPEKAKQIEKISNYVAEQVKLANEGDKFVGPVDIAKKTFKKFNLTPQKGVADKKTGIVPKAQAEGRFRLDPGTYPAIKNLQTAEEKIDSVLKKMLLDDKPLGNLWYRELSKKTGFTNESISKLFKKGNILTYNKIKDEGADFLVKNFSKAKNFDFLKELSFSDQLSQASEMIEGRPIITYGKQAKFVEPKYNVMNFAFRSWEKNEGKGPIKFFDKKTNKEITWDYGRRIKGAKSYFTYKGKKFDLQNLTDTAFIKKSFPEVYERTVQAATFGNKKIDNPFKPGSKIEIRKLVKKIQVDGYGWRPKTSTIDILHGEGGVKNEPFTNLRYNTRDINSVEASLTKKLNAKNPDVKISKQTYNKAMNELNSAFLTSNKSEYDQAIINRLQKQSEKIKKKMFYGISDLTNNIIQGVENLPNQSKIKICRALKGQKLGGITQSCEVAMKQDPAKTATIVAEEIDSLPNKTPEIIKTGRAARTLATTARSFLKGTGLTIAGEIPFEAAAAVNPFKRGKPGTEIIEESLIAPIASAFGGESGTPYGIGKDLNIQRLEEFVNNTGQTGALDFYNYYKNQNTLDQLNEKLERTDPEDPSYGMLLNKIDNLDKIIESTPEPTNEQGNEFFTYIQRRAGTFEANKKKRGQYGNMLVEGTTQKSVSDAASELNPYLGGALDMFLTSEDPYQYGPYGLKPTQRRKLNRDPEFKEAIEDYTKRQNLNIMYPTTGTFAKGGLANLTTTVAPQSGPNSKGLESLRKYATKTY